MYLALSHGLIRRPENKRIGAVILAPAVASQHLPYPLCHPHIFFSSRIPFVPIRSSDSENHEIQH